MYKVVNSVEVPMEGITSVGRPADDRGHFIKKLVDGKEKGICCVLVQLDPGASGPEEDFVIHPDYDEFEYIVYGHGRALYPDGKTFPLSPGTIVYHSAGQPHRFENTSDEPMLFIVGIPVGEYEKNKRIPFRPE